MGKSRKIIKKSRLSTFRLFCSAQTHKKKNETSVCNYSMETLFNFQISKDHSYCVLNGRYIFEKCPAPDLYYSFHSIVSLICSPTYLLVSRSSFSWQVNPLPFLPARQFRAKAARRSMLARGKRKRYGWKQGKQTGSEGKGFRRFR